MAKPYLLDDGNDFDVDEDEFDATTISEWLEVRDFDPTPVVPGSARDTLRWAHDNERAWSMVDLPDDMDADEAKALMVELAGAQQEADAQAARDAWHPWAQRINIHHDKSGKFAPKLTAGTPAMGAAPPPAKQINRSHLSNPETPRTRKVSSGEFQTIAGRGRERMVKMRERSAPANAITDAARFQKVKDRAWNDSREPWGGGTINPRTGKFLTGDEDLYALTIKPPGVKSVRIPADATREEFDAAMDTAAERFGEQLTYENSHLGVFHDDDLKSIDIDPVTIVDSVTAVEEIGAYTNAVGGAYHFKSGDGFWPPYVDD
jgi:hypothetical protein